MDNRFRDRTIKLSKFASDAFTVLAIYSTVLGVLAGYAQWPANPIGSLFLSRAPKLEDYLLPFELAGFFFFVAAILIYLGIITRCKVMTLESQCAPIVPEVPSDV